MVLARRVAATSNNEGEEEVLPGSMNGLGLSQQI
ncbi:hypothetical protein HG66A1_54700 [Gimesia chilikensis]|uniref:Uncharacterized protein n=1 Tax=Gimesia chilikensis TaxID=2605989 RepID=A0A517PWA2_9PLAN|nr:hypothetical protein HG66A1_54700 [Gimesia chilikensis]